MKKGQQNHLFRHDHDVDLPQMLQKYDLTDKQKKKLLFLKRYGSKFSDCNRFMMDFFGKIISYTTFKSIEIPPRTSSRITQVSRLIFGLYFNNYDFYFQDSSKQTVDRSTFSDYLNSSSNHSDRKIESIFWINQQQKEILKRSIGIFFDTTYCVTNTDYKLVVITTYTPTMSIVNVAYALLINEKKKSFKWLFDSFQSMFSFLFLSSFHLISFMHLTILVKSSMIQNALEIITSSIL